MQLSKNSHGMEMPLITNAIVFDRRDLEDLHRAKTIAPAW